MPLDFEARTERSAWLPGLRSRTCLNLGFSGILVATGQVPAAAKSPQHSGPTKGTTKCLDSEVERWCDWELSGAAMTTAPARQRRLSMGLSAGQPEPRLYDRVVEMLRTSRYSRRTDAGSFCHNPPDRLRKPMRGENAGLGCPIGPPRLRREGCPKEWKSLLSKELWPALGPPCGFVLG